MRNTVSILLGCILLCGVAVSSRAAKNGGSTPGGGGGACKACDCEQISISWDLPAIMKCQCLASDGLFGWGGRDCNLGTQGVLGNETCYTSNPGKCSSIDGGSNGGFHP